MNRQYKKYKLICSKSILVPSLVQTFVTSDAEIIFEKCFELNK